MILVISVAKKDLDSELEKQNVKEIPLNFKYDIKHLEIIPKRFVTSMMLGNYKSIFRGRGLEFEGFRKYIYGDDARLIDWKVSLKTNELLVKEFVEERNLNVFFAFDVSSKMCTGSIEKFKNEYAAEFIASIAYAVMQVGDAVGLGMFNDNITANVFPNTGASQFYSIRKALANPQNYGGGCDLIKALKQFNQHLNRGSMLIIVSDFIGLLNEETVIEFEILLKTLSKKYDVIGVMVRDIRDRQLPRGVGNVLISDPVTGKETVINPDEIGTEYESFVRAEEDEIRRMFRKSNAGIIILETGKPFIYPVLKFFKGRSEQMR